MKKNDFRMKKGRQGRARVGEKFLISSFFK